MKYKRKTKKKNKQNYYGLSGILITIYLLFFNTLYTPLDKSIYGYLLIIIITSTFLLININKKILITRIDFSWIIYLFWLIMRATLNISRTNMTIIIVFSVCVLMIIFLKKETLNYKFIFNLILGLSIIYTIGNLIQYLFPTFYNNYIINIIFPEKIKFFRGINGFTRQTAHSAGYILNGIGIVFLNIIFYEKKKNKNIILLFLLMFALILTLKRAHLLFSIISLLLIYILKNSGFKKVKSLLKILLILFIVIGLVYIYNYKIGFDSNSLLVEMYSRITESIVGAKKGEDITSGRNILYGKAWEMFKDKPLLGNGWDSFRENNIGILVEGIASNVHNIYLQLLTDTGIIGLILFLIPVLGSYTNSITLIKELRKSNRNSTELYVMLYSVYQQTFFILYGITGQGLQNYNFLGMYLFSILMFTNINYKYKTIRIVK